MENYGYNFYFKIENEAILLPITPAELTIKNGSNNKVVTLIDEGDINILKSPALTEVEFEARFPMRKFPYSRNPLNFQSYFDVFKDLKENKKPFRFIVTREKPNWDTNLSVALEEIEMTEDAEEGDDVLIKFKLKQYKPYGVRFVQKDNTDSESATTSTSETEREGDNNSDENKEYTVKSGDCLWTIAKYFYGNGAKWGIIYDANKDVIESTAKKYGRASSSNGHWIYPNTKLVIPALT